MFNIDENRRFDEKQLIKGKKIEKKIVSKLSKSKKF